MSDNELKLSAFQNRVLLIPEDHDIFLGGGRGGGKSHCFALLVLRHVEQYGAGARILYIRQSYKGIADFEQICRDIFGGVYGAGARYNQAEHVWRFPNGAYCELGQLEGTADYSKYQGRSFTLLLVDECGQYAEPALLDRLRSNLRGSKNIPIRMVKAANPGDPGHHWIAQRYVFKSKPWEPFLEHKSGRTWVYCPSTFVDNPHIDQDEYRKQLESSCPTDPELLRAWLEGDWAVNRGAYFAHVLSEDRNAIEPWDGIPQDPWGRTWDLFLAHDYGASAPSVTYVMAESPGMEGPDGRYYPKGSLCVVDELATNEPGSLTKGLGWTVPILAEAIVELVEPWGMGKRPQGVADDAIFSVHGSGAGSIAQEFSREGVNFRAAKKADRKSGWEIMRRMLQDAGKPDKPGLYISRACEYFWATVPYLSRDPKRQDDVDTRGPDHAADAIRYGCLRQRLQATTHRVRAD